MIFSTIPPNDGIAMGSIMSEPFPVELSMGNNAKMVVAVVIMAGLTLLNQPSTTASSISAIV